MLATVGVTGGGSCVNLDYLQGGYRCGTCPPGLRTVGTVAPFSVERHLTHGIVDTQTLPDRINGSLCLLPEPPARPVDGSPYDPGVTVQPKITLKLKGPNCSAVPLLRQKIATALKLRETDLFAMGCGSSAVFHRRLNVAVTSNVTENAQVSFMLIAPNAAEYTRQLNYQLRDVNSTLIETSDVLAAPYGVCT